MDDEGDLTTRSTNFSTMENTPKPTMGSKVKLKVTKKKVNLRHKNRLNRSNSSFNTSLNASMKMKQTLRNNNKALAQALQITKQDLAWATDMIASLQKENKTLMMEKAVSNHVISQSIDGQVNEKLKPFVQSTKAKIREATKNLLAVASALQEISSNLTSQFGNLSNPNSRVNSLEICQDLPNVESNKLPSESTETTNSPKKRRSSFCPPPSLRNGPQPINDLNVITESSLLNLNQAQNSIDVLDMVLENESEKSKEVNEIKSVKADKPPQRVPVEGRRSMSRRDSMNRRQSMDEIDFGPNVVKSRKTRRSSFFLPTGCIDKALRPSLETDVKNDETCMDDDDNHSDEEDKKIETEQIPSPTLPEDDDTTILLGEPPILTSFMHVPKVTSDTNQDVQPELPTTTTQSSDSPLLFTESPAQQQHEQQHEDIDLVEADDFKTALTTQTEEINNTNIIEMDMELTEVINSSVQVNDEVTSLPDAESAKKNIETSASPSTDSADSKGSSEKEDAVFVKPPRVPKRKKADTKKDEKKQTKNTKEKVKEIPTEDENRAVIELKLPKPGKIIFSATRKNIAGIRLSPQKVRSKKKLAELKKNELAAEPKNLFDFHDKTPQMLVKKPEPAETGIYDVSLNDSVYGTCQSLGEYRERVAMAKRISSVNGGPSSSTSDAPLTEVSEGKKETAVEAVPDTSAKPAAAEEKKKRARSKKAVDGDGEEKKMRSRSKKRVADSDSDSDEDKTYIKHYQKSVKNTEAPERELTRRARSKVVSYKEVESDFDVTLTEIRTLVPLKKTVENQKDSSGTKVEKPKEETAPKDEDVEPKNTTKKQTGRKSLKETDEKRTRSRKKSTAGKKATDDPDDDPLSEATESHAAEKSDLVLKGTERIADLMSRLEKLQTKRSRSQHRSEKKADEEIQNTTETATAAAVVSKPKSTTSDIVERYKLALASCNDTKDDLKKRENSKSRSRPARNETSDKTVQNQKGRSRSLHAQKSSDNTDDKVESALERKRSRSVAKKKNEKTDECSPPSSPKKKQEESPEIERKRQTERGRSKSRARSNVRSSTRSTSVENKPEESPDSLQRKIRKDRGRSRSKVILDKTDESDAVCNKILASDATDEDKCEVESNVVKKTRARSIAGKELLLKLKSLNSDKENKVMTDTNVGQNTDTNTRKSAETTNITETKKTKNSSEHINPDLDLSSLPNKIPTVSPKKSLERNYGKRSSECATDENQDLKRPRRATKPMSYKEPSIGKKLRQGDKLFGDVQANRNSSGSSLPKMIDGEQPRKRSILENLTNLNC